MSINQKCQYALKALFELAKHGNERPASVGEIAARQAIPTRFLEVILNELKQGGFVESRRGKHGGYVLVRKPRDIAVGEVIRFVQGTLSPVQGTSVDQSTPCVFQALWKRVEDATSAIYDHTTLRDLIDEEARLASNWTPDFNI